MKPSHLAVLSATLVSFAAVAQDKPKQEPSAQSGQTQAATQQKGQKSGAQMSQSPELIKQAQEKLSAAGHDAGPADGIMGPRTQKALKDFQQAKNLEASGQLDQKTLSALGVSGEASATAGASADKPKKEPSAGADKPKDASAGASAGAGATGGASAQPKPAEPKPAEPKTGGQPSDKPKN
jgi:peptidoglycan hydrolase-like protein with peptidoglycan-binding domain